MKKLVLWSLLHIGLLARGVDFFESFCSVEDKEIRSISKFWSVILLAPKLIVGLIFPQAMIQVVPACDLCKERPRIAGQGMEFESVSNRDRYLDIISIVRTNFNVVTYIENVNRGDDQEGG